MKVKFSSDLINMSADVPESVAHELAVHFFGVVSRISTPVISTPSQSPVIPVKKEAPKKLTSLSDLGKALSSPPTEAQVHSEQTSVHAEPVVKEVPKDLIYKGFLHIKCSHCGETRAFFAKEPITYYRCKECGKESPFKEPLKLMILSCPSCGKEFKYRTNSTEPRITHTCIECGAPVDMEYIEKKHCYLTMK